MIIINLFVLLLQTPNENESLIRMIDINSSEIYWLTLTVVMTALLWVPQILNSLVKSGPVKAFLYPDAASQEYSDWAQRSKAAHSNAVQNLVIFAPLVILLILLDLENDLTALAAMFYFLSRILHYILHVLAIPLLRTVAFLIGFACQLVIGLSILSVL